MYIYLQNFLSDITDRWQFFMGLIFIVMVLFVPGGLSKLIEDVGVWARTRWHRATSEPQEES